MFHRPPLTLLALFVYQVSAAPASETVTEERLNTTLPGERLVSLGRQLDSPLLRIIGHTFLDMYSHQSRQMCQLQLQLQLQLHLRVPCQEWSQWSQCSATMIGTFGARNRTRECGGEACPAKREDTEEARCEGTCPTECQEWSEWSKCSAKRVGMDGVRSRTRECGGEAEKCPDYPTKRVDTEEERCKETCPTGYSLTSGGLCLKYLKKYIKHRDAEGLCSKDGGFIVNINTREKLQDIENTFKHSNAYWVDGTRASSVSPWQYRYGGAPEYMNWYRKEPKNAPNHLCQVYFRSKRFSANCGISCTVLCEII